MGPFLIFAFLSVFAILFLANIILPLFFPDSFKMFWMFKGDSEKEVVKEHDVSSEEELEEAKVNLDLAEERLEAAEEAAEAETTNAEQKIKVAGEVKVEAGSLKKKFQ
ncbi:hypothetical protein KAR91_00685 [Candidatus Pacearchaeota archaeon]|nr:hypothetical protein [Candidatus Pacearchaeota archaeon]